MPRWSLDDPQIKENQKKRFVFMQKPDKTHCFVMNDHFDHEFDYRTYLELKISIRAFDYLNITSISLLECSFVPKEGPMSMFRYKPLF